VRRSLRGPLRDLLASVRAEALERRMLGVFSGGEMQRVLLALALQQDPDVLVLDEPAAGVDVQGGLFVLRTAGPVAPRAGLHQLMVSHDLATVTHHATHVILLNRRVVAEGRRRRC
jgi:zinc transport system ATP-binding protein